MLKTGPWLKWRNGGDGAVRTDVDKGQGSGCLTVTAAVAFDRGSQHGQNQERTLAERSLPAWLTAQGTPLHYRPVVMKQVMKQVRPFVTSIATTTSVQVLSHGPYAPSPPPHASGRVCSTVFSHYDLAAMMRPVATGPVNIKCCLLPHVWGRVSYSAHRGRTFTFTFTFTCAPLHVCHDARTPRITQS